ncbi:NHL repeat-containing protein [candidate division KSB1 bacterium]|nr:NHL repeat-containing protein [candidate division KSB1 bacterium]
MRRTHLAKAIPSITILLVTVLSAQNMPPDLKPEFDFKWVVGIGSKGTSAAQFRQPQALSVDPEGCIYVCDTGNHRIQKFSHRGEFIVEIGGFGWEKEQFYQPTDIHARSGLDIFIADYQNQRVQRYDRELNYISSLKSHQTWQEKLQFGLPLGIGFSNKRELFIVDDENCRIIKFDSFGEPELYFGDFDAGQGRLKQPIQIEVDQNNQVFVSDKSAGMIYVYDYFGNFIKSFGEKILSKPHGLFHDSGLLFVADIAKNQIVIFQTSGELIAICDKYINAPQPFIEPVDVVVFNNMLYVLDQETAIIHIIEIRRSSRN